MTYVLFLWRMNRGFLLFAMAVTALFQILILRIVTSLDTPPIILGLLEQMPAGVRRMLGEDALSILTVEGMAAFGFNHPLVLVILSIAAILVPARHVAGEAEAGTLELLLSFPVRRTRLLGRLFAASASFLSAIILGALGASLLGLAVFHRSDAEVALRLAGIACNLWLLFVLVASMTLALSSYEKEGHKVGMRMAGVTLVFYLLHYLSSLWDVLEVTKPFNIFTYYRPAGLMTGEHSLALHVAVLSALIVVCLAVALHRFNRRDIPG